MTLSRADIFSRLASAIEGDTGESLTNVNEKTSIREDLGMDSVDVIGAVNSIERELHIRLTTQDISKFITLGDVVDVIEREVSKDVR